jgi:hypothetical protein
MTTLYAILIFALIMAVVCGVCYRLENHTTEKPTDETLKRKGG